MEAPSSCRWSELPVDIWKYLLERLSFSDFHRAKMVCSNWYLCSKQALRPKFRSPLVLLSPEEGGCRLYNPEEDRFYETKSDLSGYQFLGSSGKWFLVVDSRSDLYIIDTFSDERISLPRLETLKGGIIFDWGNQTSKDVRGLVWVDDKTRDYVVVWRVGSYHYLGFCKKGDVRYREITLRTGLRSELRNLADIVLKGYHLYLLSTREYIRHLDLSGDDVKDKTVNHRHPMLMPIMSKADEEALKAYETISVSYTRAYDPTSGRPRIFWLYKRDAKDLYPDTYNTWLVEVDSLGDEALFFDLGVTVPADQTLGIEPNSIYFTRNDRRFDRWKRSTPTPCIEVCVYNLATKNIKRFPSLSNFKLSDAMWFIPS